MPAGLIATLTDAQERQSEPIPVLLGSLLAGAAEFFSRWSKKIVLKRFAHFLSKRCGNTR